MYSFLALKTLYRVIERSQGLIYQVLIALILKKSHSSYIKVEFALYEEFL